MKPKPWKLADYINTREDLVNYLEAAIKEKDFSFLFIACKDFIEIARDKRWAN